MNNNAREIAKNLINKSIQSQIRNARKSLNSYIGDYMKTIQEQKIKLSSNSKEQIEKRINELNLMIENISKILSEIK